MRRCWLLLGILAILFAACETYEPSINCTAIAVPAIAVAVMDSVTGASAADGARVYVRDGAFVDTLSAPPIIVPGEPNYFSGPFERPGTYVVTVEKIGYKMWSRSGITVTEDECHVITVTLAAELVPE